MGKVTGSVKIFYEDQKGPRECCISGVIDLEYAEKAKKTRKSIFSNRKLRSSLYQGI